MPSLVPVVINDGQAAPVAHTFSPTKLADGMSLFEDKIGGIGIGFPSIVVMVKRPGPARNGESSNATTRAYKVTVNVNLPVLESTSAATGTGIPPAPTVAMILRHAGQWILPERSTTQDRKNLHAFVYNLLNNADIKKVLIDLEDYY
ncbi:coat protein [ssRNA phage SRR6960549_4]|uniref:Coat protein n=1 Tax=ssRNA phage SRR6960549_4 TaxID=2786541 RepID=A0A8S5L4X5_9VIRU|nr:coat protein [ssRNA phage SRR6960549_4]DAD52595.1 TPA_asm: coat protein [ssRNA phage SRR6960549_4]